MKHSKELKIGIFVITVLITSFFLINYLRGEDIFNKEIELVSRYDDLEGLVASAPVYIKGYKAGKVSEVTYEPSHQNADTMLLLHQYGQRKAMKEQGWDCKTFVSIFGKNYL